jgi:hypothetical protein
VLLISIFYAYNVIINFFFFDFVLFRTCIMFSSYIPLVESQEMNTERIKNCDYITVMIGFFRF